MTVLLLAGQTNDEILQSLSHRLAPTSEYIQQRWMSRFYPSGASSYSSNTTQIARVELKGQGGFLDLSTLKIAFRLVNSSTERALILAGGRMLWCLAFVSFARQVSWKIATTMGEFTICSPN